MGGAIIVVICVIGSIIWGLRAGKKRKSELGELAARLGLQFSGERNYPMVERYAFLGQLQQGENRYAYNVLSGGYQGHAVTVFDYHYETQFTDSNEKRQTHHHLLSFFIMEVHDRATSKDDVSSLLTKAAKTNDLTIELYPNALALCFDSPLKAGQIETRLKQLIEMAGLIPPE